LCCFVPLHLLYPLFSSVVFVFGMLFSKQAITRGASPWTGTFLVHLWLAVIWLTAGAWSGEWLPVSHWWHAAVFGIGFLLGQLFSYFAFRYGDVSVATPVFGVKVIMVAVIAAVSAGDPIAPQVWLGAVLATIGVMLVQSGITLQGHRDRRRAVLTVVLALAGAASLSVFDVGLQVYGRPWGATRYLPVLFGATCGFSACVLPWCDRPRTLHKQRALLPVLAGSLLIATQAVTMSYSLSSFGDATRINIVYALRGLWAVLLAWILARFFGGGEARQSVRVMLSRLLGAVLLTASVVVALWPAAT
jgi:drug/metabolite transporter (DMT)-like permease